MYRFYEGTPAGEVIKRVPACDRDAVAREVLTFCNSTPDAGRPSDAARAVVNRYFQNAHRPSKA